MDGVDRYTEIFLGAMNGDPDAVREAEELRRSGIMKLVGLIRSELEKADETSAAEGGRTRIDVARKFMRGNLGIKGIPKDSTPWELSMVDEVVAGLAQ